MNRNAVEWIVGAIAVLGLAAVTLILGKALLPTRLVAQGVGTLVPWFLTWCLIWTTALIAVVIAGQLIMIGVSKIRRSQ